MKRIMKYTICLGLLFAMLINVGCTSLIRYQYSKDELIQQRIIASGDQKAIDALKMGVEPRQVLKLTVTPNGAMIGVDVLDPSTWDVIMQHPWQQLGLLVTDGVMTYGTYKIGDKQGWWGNQDSSSKSTSVTGNNNSSININQGGPHGNIQINVNTAPVSSGDSGAGSGPAAGTN